jgi:hypothetical protein
MKQDALFLRQKAVTMCVCVLFYHSILPSAKAVKCD